MTTTNDCGCKKDDGLQNLGVCGKCQKVVPVSYKEQDGKLFLVKACPDCGPNEVLISSSIENWKQKREMCGYDQEVMKTCGLNCLECNHGKHPSLVFMDVTNRCNMNCPICLANITAMGFRFDPPMEYFEKIFKKLGAMDPRPKIQLFGGEPTVRKDLIEIINKAKSYGLSARVVTNGLKLADEEYCKELLATRSQLMLSFDGDDPAIYHKIRKTDSSLERKLKALENVRKYRKSKITIMCCAGLGVNDDKMGDMLQFCHDRRDFIAALDLIPLVETWGPDQVQGAGNTTINDVEEMVAKALPGTEFLPAGLLLRIKNITETFKVGRLTFGGAHPNCESVTALVSDGKQYLPLSKFLKRSFADVAREAVALDEKLPDMLKHSLLAKLLGKKGEQIAAGLKAFSFFKRNVNLQEVFGGSVTPKLFAIAWGLLKGKKMKNLLRQHTKFHNILRVIVLPFEEPVNVESARLVECPASFVYEHPETHEINFMPVCSWCVYKDQILRKTAETYGVGATA